MRAQLPPADVVCGILSSIEDITGPRASYALFHYGASEEGKRLVASGAIPDLDHAFTLLKDVFAHRAELVSESGGAIVVKATPASEWTPALRGAVLGLLEGVITAQRRVRHSGTIRPSSEDGPFVMEFRETG